MGDSVSNQGEITPKGVDGSIQLAAGGDLKSVDGVTVTDAGKLTAVIFSGDGGLLSNVSGGGGGVGDLQQVSDTGNTTSNTIQFTNTITSLTTSGNVAVNGATTTDAILSVKSDTSAVLALESETALSGIGFKTSTTTSGGAVPALGVSGDNIVFYPGVPAALAVTIDADKDMTVVGNVSANKIIGDGSELTNTTDASEGTYGDSSTVAAITVNSDGRIDSISAISINFPSETQGLQEVTERGNVSSNTIELTNVTTGITVTSNIVNEKLVGNCIIFTTSSGNVLTTSENLTYSSNILSVDGGEGGILTRKLEYINKFDTPPGVNILAGQPCYITSQGGTGEVEANLALNTNSDYMPAIGLALTDYNRNDSGYIVRSGKVLNIQDSVFIDTPTNGDRGKVVYVSSTSGKLTFDRPTGNTNLIQNIGILLTASTNQNTILVQGAGRANDTPNFIDCNQANVKYNLSITDGSLVESTNLYVTGNVYVDNVNANAIVTNGNMVCSNIYGNGQGLSNTINNSIAGGTYGDSSTVAAITVSSDGRIDSISAISISFPAETQSLQDVTDNGPTTTNEVSFTNSPNSLTASSNITVTGNVNAGYLWGEGSNITNTVDASEGTYGDGGSNVAVIVVSPDGRIDSISNTEITTSNLQQVTDTGNITSNIIQFTNTGTSIKTSGLANIANLEVYGTHTELSDLSGTTLTVDAQGHSYRTANVRTAGNSINTLSISNLKRSAQMVVYIECTTSASNVSGKGTLTGAKSCHSNIEMSTSDTVVLTLTNDGTTNYASACKFE